MFHSVRSRRLQPIVKMVLALSAMTLLATGCNATGKTGAATSITDTTATLNASGSVTAGTSGAAVYFKYAPATATTLVWKDTPHQRYKSGYSGSHTAKLIMLTPNRGYVYKICERDLVYTPVAVSESTTEACDVQQRFATLASPPITLSSFSGVTPQAGSTVQAPFRVLATIATSKLLGTAEIALSNSPVLTWVPVQLTRNTLGTAYFMYGSVSSSTTLNPGSTYKIYVRLRDVTGAPVYENTLTHFTLYTPGTA